MLKNFRGQVWVETIIYTLIALTIIGLVLSFVKPKIEEMQDKAIIEQSIELMKDIDGIIKEVVVGGAENKRKIELGIKKGSLQINGAEDFILFEIESAYTYSEPGRNIYDEYVLIRTEEKGKYDLVTLKIDYKDKDYNLIIDDTEINKTLNKGSLPYQMFITNKGVEAGTIKINFEIK